jgi:hypothetical protein
MTVLRSDVIDSVDLALSRHQDFAAPDAIDERNLARLRLGLTTLARLNPALASTELVGQDDRTLALFLRDPVLRNAFEADLAAAVTRSTTTGTALADVLPLTQLSAGRGPAEELASHGAKAWPGLGPAFVWQDFDREAGPIGRRMDSLIDGIFPEPSAEAPIAATPAHLAGLRQGAGLLAELLPGVGPNVLHHIGAVGLARNDTAEGPLLSMSGGDGLPATIFLGPDWLRDPWDTAGLILHEGLHLTLFEVIRCGTMLTGDAVGVSELPIPWRKLRWSSARALFALHVYVHMALFEAAVATADDRLRIKYGEPPANAAAAPHTPGTDTAYDTPLARASYLAEQLERLNPQLLTPYGLQFVGWLGGILEELAPGIRDRWAPRRPANESSAEVSVLPDGTFRLTPAESIPLPSQRRLALATTEPPGVGWLNVQLWTIYALCDGQDVAGVQRRYAEALSGTPGAAYAQRDAADGLQQLLQRGLITVT